MFKKLSLVLAALLVGAFAFADPLTADGGATPAKAGSVNATWEWTKIPKSKIGTDEMTFKKQVVLEPVAGSVGAKFALENGAAKFKTEAYTALYHGTKDASRIETLLTKPGDRKATYSITIDDAATITLTLAGNGSAGKQRCVDLVKEDAEGNPTLILGIDGLSQDVDPVPYTYSNAPAGTYKIYGNGFRIVKVECKN